MWALWSSLSKRISAQCSEAHTALCRVTPAACELGQPLKWSAQGPYQGLTPIRRLASLLSQRVSAVQGLAATTSQGSDWRALQCRSMGPPPHTLGLRDHRLLKEEAGQGPRRPLRRTRRHLLQKLCAQCKRDGDFPVCMLHIAAYAFSLRAPPEGLPLCAYRLEMGPQPDHALIVSQGSVVVALRRRKNLPQGNAITAVLHLLRVFATMPSACPWQVAEYYFCRAKAVGPMDVCCRFQEAATTPG